MEHKVAKSWLSELQIVALLGLFLADGLYFALTNPRQGHTAVVIAGAALAILTIYAAAWVTARLLGMVFSLAPRSERVIAAVLGTPIMYGLLMQSIGQLNAKDILAVVPLALVGYFYFAYGRNQQATDKIGH